MPRRLGSSAATCRREIVVAAARARARRALSRAPRRARGARRQHPRSGGEPRDRLGGGARRQRPRRRRQPSTSTSPPGFGVAAIGHRHPRVVAAVARAGRPARSTAWATSPRTRRASRSPGGSRALAPVDDAAGLLRDLRRRRGRDRAQDRARSRTGRRGDRRLRARLPRPHPGRARRHLAAGVPRALRRAPPPHVARLPFGGDLDARSTRALAGGDVGASSSSRSSAARACSCRPPAGSPRLAELCRARTARCSIADEIFTGFGRTGALFAVEHEGVRPDLLCCGKALGGGLPIAAVVGRARAHRLLGDRPGEALHTATFLAHPLACAAALATLDVLAARGPRRRAPRGSARRIGARLAGLAASASRRSPRCAAAACSGASSSTTRAPPPSGWSAALAPRRPAARRRPGGPRRAARAAAHHRRRAARRRARSGPRRARRERSRRRRRSMTRVALKIAFIGTPRRRQDDALLRPRGAAQGARRGGRRRARGGAALPAADQRGDHRSPRSRGSSTRQIAEELVAAARYPVVICDRSVLDNYVYLLLAAGRQDRRSSRLVERWMRELRPAGPRADLRAAAAGRHPLRRSDLPARRRRRGSRPSSRRAASRRWLSTRSGPTPGSTTSRPRHST